jgi:hypothetical protein
MIFITAAGRSIVFSELGDRQFTWHRRGSGSGLEVRTSCFSSYTIIRLGAKTIPGSSVITMCDHEARFGPTTYVTAARSTRWPGHRRNGQLIRPGHRRFGPPPTR